MEEIEFDGSSPVISTKRKNITILFPTLEPSKQFITFLKELRKATSQPGIVIDDGSGDSYQPIFREIEQIKNVIVSHQPENRGKGQALKTGFNLQSAYFPDSEGIVTADSDGQHSIFDILNLSSQLQRGQSEIILGSRYFNKENTPFKSYWGNRLTSSAFFLATGIKCSDTQTGLRGIPQDMLLKLKELDSGIIEVPIETIYLNQNSGSHFRVIEDSVRIYWPMLSYLVSSLSSALIDVSVFTIFIYLTSNHTWQNLLVATVLARLTSGAFNFSINKYLFFQSENRVTTEAWKYLILFVSQLVLSWFFLQLIAPFFIQLIFLKVLIDVGLFFGSYAVQKGIVFR